MKETSEAIEGVVESPILSPSALQQLEQSNFDPIISLVAVYKRLEEEDKYWCNIRNFSSVVELNPMGKKLRTVRYSSVAHVSILAQLRQVASDLLRYKYTRVDEGTAIETIGIPMMSINSTSGRSVRIGVSEDD